MPVPDQEKHTWLCPLNEPNCFPLIIKIEPIEAFFVSRVVIIGAPLFVFSLTTTGIDA